MNELHQRNIIHQNSSFRHHI